MADISFVEIIISFVFVLFNARLFLSDQSLSCDSVSDVVFCKISRFLGLA